MLMRIRRACIKWLPPLLVACGLWLGLASAHAQSLEAVQATKEDSLGFKIGLLRIHPGLTVANVYDTNVQNRSKDNKEKIVGDDLLKIVGALKLHYPDPRLAFTLDGAIAYTRYFGVVDPDTKNLSALDGNARLALTLFRDSVAGFSLSDQVTRAVSPKMVGLGNTNDRIHNTGIARLHVKPGGGQLRLYFGYTNDLEHYDQRLLRSQNWLEHTANFDWELEFLPSTAVFMRNTFGYRDYWQYSKADNPADGVSTVNTKSPNAMPFRTMIGIMGRISSHFLLNVSAGYGNSFSKNFQDFNSAIAKAEVTGQFTERTALKVGFERDFSPVTTYSFTVDNKIYMEFKQWLFRDSLKLYFYGSYNFIQYGAPDKGISLIPSGLSATPVGLSGNRLDHELTLTPSIRYDFLRWLYVELGYTLTWHNTNYFVERVTLNTSGNYTKTRTYYDYLKHEAMVKLSLAY